MTTGRPRRCGWLDLVQLKYAHAINNFTCINITKLDVLSGLPEVKVCIGYEYQGKRLPSFPASLHILGQVKPVYATFKVRKKVVYYCYFFCWLKNSGRFKGWNEDISKCRTRAELPKTAQEYLAFIEKEAGVRAVWVGVGAGREGWRSPVCLVVVLILTCDFAGMVIAK